MAEAEDKELDATESWQEQTVYGPSTVIAALDQIEDLIADARNVPLSANIMINKAELLDLLDQAREALPDDLVAADAVVADADAVLGRADSAAEVTIAEANTRAESTLSEAKEKAEMMVAQAQEEADSLLQNAEEEAHRLTEQAEADAHATLTDANAQAERLVSAENITEMARERARDIVADAQEKDANLRRGADEYVAQSLGQLAALLADMQRKTDAGRRTVAQRSGTDVTDIELND